MIVHVYHIGAFKFKMCTKISWVHNSLHFETLIVEAPPQNQQTNLSQTVYHCDEKCFLIIDFLTPRWCQDNEGSCELCVGTEGKDVSAPGIGTATDCFVK